MKKTMLVLGMFLGACLTTGTADALEVDRHVIVASRVIHPIRVSAGGFTPEQRVAKVNERLATIIAREPLAPSNIRMRVVSGTPGIYVGRYLVISVTQADATYHRTTPRQLAQIWLREYRRVLPQARPDQNWGVKDQ